MNQLQNGLGQYQPSGTDPEPPTVHAQGQYQRAGNNDTPLEREDLNSDAIVDAQLTHLISRDDAPQGQDAPNASDVPMPDAPTVHDIATPRRTIGSVHSLQWANASVLPVICVEHDSQRVKRDYNSGVAVKPTITMYMHTVSMEGLVMIMNCTRR